MEPPPSNENGKRDYFVSGELKWKTGTKRKIEDQNWKLFIFEIGTLSKLTTQKGKRKIIAMNTEQKENMETQLASSVVYS